MSTATVRLERVGGGLAREVKTRSGASPMSCLQCAKCTSGCPVASRADLRPHELVRLVQMDQRRAVLASRSIWECTSCQTCVSRCPQKVDVAAMNDALRAMSLAAGLAPPETAVPAFNELFLKSVRKRGRVHELRLMAEFKLRTAATVARSSLAVERQGLMETLRRGAAQLLADADKAPMMIAKGKLPLLGPRVRGKAQRKAMFRRAAGGNS
jgi:heterodisulfide reductase subunit C/quinone-modifying oxidoreductase subunit QmoC